MSQYLRVTHDVFDTPAAGLAGPATLMVYLRLLRSVWRSGDAGRQRWRTAYQEDRLLVASLSQGRIASDLMLDRKTVNKSLRRLREMGWIVAQPTGEKEDPRMDYVLGFWTLEWANEEKTEQKKVESFFLDLLLRDLLEVQQDRPDEDQVDALRAIFDEGPRLARITMDRVLGVSGDEKETEETLGKISPGGEENLPRGVGRISPGSGENLPSSPLYGIEKGKRESEQRNWRAPSAEGDAHVSESAISSSLSEEAAKPPTQWGEEEELIEDGEGELRSPPSLRSGGGAAPAAPAALPETEAAEELIATVFRMAVSAAPPAPSRHDRPAFQASPQGDDDRRSGGLVDPWDDEGSAVQSIASGSIRFRPAQAAREVRAEVRR